MGRYIYVSRYTGLFFLQLNGTYVLGGEKMLPTTLTKPKSLERSVEYLYRKIGIVLPSQLNMFSVAEKLLIKIHLFPIRSWAFKDDGVFNVVINSQQSIQKQWQDFGHEVAHILLHGWLSEVIEHGSNQLRLSDTFVQYQETKADSFAYEFCVPSFMLQKMKLPELKHVAARYVSEHFCVTDEFAFEKLTRFENRMVQY